MGAYYYILLFFNIYYNMSQNLCLGLLQLLQALACVILTSKVANIQNFKLPLTTSFLQFENNTNLPSKGVVLIQGNIYL